MEVFHNGSQAYIENYTGTMNFTQHVNDGYIRFKCDDGSGGTATYLMLNGSITSIIAYKDFLFGADSIYAKWGASQDLIIGHDGSNSKIENYTGHLNILQNANDKDITFQCDDGSGGLTTYLTLSLIHI